MKSYRQRIELNAISCVRILNSSEELFHISMPSILNQQVYQLNQPSHDEYNKVLKVNETIMLNRNSKLANNYNTLNDCKMINNKEHFLALVNETLIKLASTDSTISCNSYSIFTFIRKSNNPNYKYVSYKEVLIALKELELNGYIYSCEDEFHYLPISF
jgi:hypothetical protein